MGLSEEKKHLQEKLCAAEKNAETNGTVLIAIGFLAIIVGIFSMFTVGLNPTIETAIFSAEVSLIFISLGSLGVVAGFIYTFYYVIQYRRIRKKLDEMAKATLNP
jgi:hypothetical protein